MATGTAGQNAATLQQLHTDKAATATALALIPKDAPEGKKIAMTASGNAALVAFNTPHGLGVIPTWWVLTPTTVAASALHTVTADITNLIVTFAVAPANAANNIGFVGFAAI